MPAVLIIPTLIVLTVSVAFLGMSSGPATCATAGSPHGLVTSQNHSKLCPSAFGSRFFGHGP